MKIRRHIVHTSFQLDADFLAYYCGDKLVSLVVEGASLPVNGEVDAATFKRLLAKVRAKEKTCRDLWAGKRVHAHDSTSGRPSDAVLPHANMREVLTIAYGHYERRWY